MKEEAIAKLVLGADVIERAQKRIKALHEAFKTTNDEVARALYMIASELCELQIILAYIFLRT